MVAASCKALGDCFNSPTPHLLAHVNMQLDAGEKMGMGGGKPRSAAMIEGRGGGVSHDQQVQFQGAGAKVSQSQQV